jgi:opacity protein-like surface antigen
MKKTVFAFAVLIGAVSSASADSFGGYGKYGIGTNQYGLLVNPYTTQRKNVPPPQPNTNGTQKRK